MLAHCRGNGAAEATEQMPNSIQQLTRTNVRPISLSLPNVHRISHSAPSQRKKENPEVSVDFSQRVL
jgi:hypothetical protein